MPTLKEQKDKALIDAGIGIKNRNKEQASKGMNDFIRISITEMEIERNMDEAELWDSYYDNDYPTDEDF